MRNSKNEKSFAHHEISKFILVTKDSFDENSKPIIALNLIKLRLKHNKWPIYIKTRCRNQFKENDDILFYVGGRNLEGGNIIAQGKIKSISKKANYEIFDDEPPVFYLEFKDVTFFINPINFTEKVKHLSFFPKNEKKWGVVLMGGCRKISKGDWDILFKTNKM
jgi:hypothetical protein